MRAPRGEACALAQTLTPYPSPVGEGSHGAGNADE